METLGSNAQAARGKIVDVPWDQIIPPLAGFAKTLEGKPGPIVLAGIPRGGAIIAGLLRAMLPKARLTVAHIVGNVGKVQVGEDVPPENVFIIDDVIDSGATIDAFTNTRYQILALISKNDAASSRANVHALHTAMPDAWLQFPWEHALDADPAFYIGRALQTCGFDTTEAMKDTPQRIAKLWNEYSPIVDDEIIGQVLGKQFDADTADVVIAKNVEFSSLCSHHMLPFEGRATIAYVPRAEGERYKVIGVSKLARIVKLLAFNATMQETLTCKIADALCAHLSPDVFVTLEATHTCMTCRGVEAAGSSIITSAIRGLFVEHQPVRAEVLALCRN